MSRRRRDPTDIPEWPDYLIQQAKDGYRGWARTGGLVTVIGPCDHPDKVLAHLQESVPRPSRHGLLPPVLAQQLDIIAERRQEIRDHGIDLRLSVADIKLLAVALSVDLDRMEAIPTPEGGEAERLAFWTRADELQRELYELCPDFRIYQGFGDGPARPHYLMPPRCVRIVGADGETDP